MNESRKLFIDPRLLQGAPLMPPEGPGEEKGDAEIVVIPEPEKESAPVETEQTAEAKTLAAQGKIVMRQAVLSGRAEGALGTAAQYTEKAKEGIDVLQKVLAMTKSRLDQDPDAEGLSSLTPSQLEIFWRFIQVPEFQNLAASLLAKMLN